MKNNKIKKKSKAKFYTIFHVVFVIILFFLLDLSSVGNIENYLEIYKFKKNIRNGNYKIDKFPPTELSGIKLFDDFEKYFFNDKEHYQYSNHETYLKINNYKYRVVQSTSLMSVINRLGKDINPSNLFENDSLIKDIPFLDKLIFADENNDKIKLIILFYDEIRLDNNKIILNICDNSRNQVLKKNNLLKSDFKRKYYKKKDDDEFVDILSFDYIINNKNGEILEPKKVNLSLACYYEKYATRINYEFSIVLSEVKAFNDLNTEFGLIETKMNVKEMIKKIK